MLHSWDSLYHLLSGTLLCAVGYYAYHLLRFYKIKEKFSMVKKTLETYNKEAYDMIHFYATKRNMQEPMVVTDQEGAEKTLLIDQNYMGLKFDDELMNYLKEFANDNVYIGRTANGYYGGATKHAHVKKILRKIYMASHDIEVTLADSCALANQGVLSGLLEPGGVVFRDRFAHNTLTQGAYMMKGMLEYVHIETFEHNSVNSLEKLLVKHQDAPVKIVVVDGLTSIHGDVPPLHEMLPLCAKHNAIFVLDEAHALGSTGKNGFGALDYHQFESYPYENLIITGSLGKAIQSSGGYILAHSKYMKHIRWSSPLLFTGVPTPLSLALAEHNLNKLLNEPERIAVAQQNAQRWNQMLMEKGLRTYYQTGCIVSFEVDVDDSKKGDMCSSLIKESHALAAMAAFPVVSKGKVVVRTTQTYLWTKERQ